MAIDNGRGSGEQDLHVSFKIEDGNYSRPKNLGSVINTKKSDFAPFLAADGETLYFASFGHGGFGGSDLYVSRRLDDSWKRWSKPKNLGPGINSEHNENYLSVTGDFSYVYFESYPSGSKDKDLFRAPLPQQFHPQNLLPQANQIELMAADAEPIANGDSPGPSTPEMKTATDYATLTSGVTPPLSNDPAGWNIDTKPKDHLIGNLRTYQYFDKGQIRNKVLKNSYFPTNSYKLTPACLSKLDEITKVLRENATLQVYIEGYADSSGLDEVNLRLSYLRAQAAAHYLIDQGISVQRLQIIGNGELQPLASNDDEKDGRELNRRVEVTLINPAGAFNSHGVN
jgi:outer membrane protein OmpA-like peptidoglycan-associated protein